MDSTQALHWLGIEQWVLRVPWPGHSTEPVTPLTTDASITDASITDAQATEQCVPHADSAKWIDVKVSEAKQVTSIKLCFIAASGAEFSALVSAISHCLPSGKTLVHLPATEDQPPCVHWDGQVWTFAELQSDGRAKRALWRALVGLTA